MTTYALSPYSDELSKSLGQEVLGPRSDKPLTGFEFSSEQGPRDILSSAHSLAASVAQDLRDQGIEPKGAQVIVTAEGPQRSAVEAALRAEGMKPVYLVEGKDANGVADTYLVEPMANRGTRETSNFSQLTDIGSSNMSPDVQRKELALWEATNGHQPHVDRARVESLADSIQKAMDDAGAGRRGRGYVISDSVPEHLSSALESSLSERGIMALYERESASINGMQMKEFVPGAGGLAAAEKQGAEALRNALGKDGKDFSDAMIRSAVGGDTLARLGSLDEKSRKLVASEMARDLGGELNNVKAADIARNTTGLYDKAAYEAKYEVIKGVPKDASAYLVVELFGQRAGWAAGGTTADMARGIDRVSDFMQARGTPVSKDDIKASIDRKSLESLGEKGFDAKKFEATHSAMKEHAAERGLPRPTALDALAVHQKLERGELGGTDAIKLDGKSLGTAAEISARANEFVRQGAERAEAAMARQDNRLPGAEPAATENQTKALEQRSEQRLERSEEARGGQEAGVKTAERTVSGGSAWDAAFAKAESMKSADREGSRSLAEDSRTRDDSSNRTGRDSSQSQAQSQRQSERELSRER